MHRISKRLKYPNWFGTETGQTAQFIRTEDWNIFYKHSKQVSFLLQDSAYARLNYDSFHINASVKRVYTLSSIYGHGCTFVSIARHMNTTQSVSATRICGILLLWIVHSEAITHPLECTRM